MSERERRIDAALQVLRDADFDMPGGALVSTYVVPGQTEDERAAGIAAMRAADQAHEAAERAVVGAALDAADKIASRCSDGGANLPQN